MKFTKKLLTVLPLSTISVITPIVVSSCSCSASYEIKYGDSINCQNKDDKNIKYHSIDEVKNASRNHIQVVTSEPITWEDAIDELKAKKTEKMQHFYWDLVYSSAYEKIDFTLVWNVSADKQEIVYKGATYSKLAYQKDGNDYYIYGDATKLVKSFSYSQPK